MSMEICNLGIYRMGQKQWTNFDLMLVGCSWFIAQFDTFIHPHVLCFFPDKTFDI